LFLFSYSYGGLYASNFNRFGKMYRVMVQADPDLRKNMESMKNIKVRGADSKKLRDYARKYIQEQQLKEQKAKRQGKEAPVPTIEEMEESVTKRAVLSIISWSGIAENGQEVPFTEENATRILKEHDWIRSAVLENSNDGSKFRPE
jgi:hypothetical protein